MLLGKFLRAVARWRGNEIGDVRRLSLDTPSQFAHALTRAVPEGTRVPERAVAALTVLLNQVPQSRAALLPLARVEESLVFSPDRGTTLVPVPVLRRAIKQLDDLVGVGVRTNVAWAAELQPVRSALCVAVRARATPEPAVPEDAARDESMHALAWLPTVRMGEGPAWASTETMEAVT